MKKKRQRKPAAAAPAPVAPLENPPTSTPAPRAPTRWWAHALVIIVLMGLNFALYQRSLDLGFFALDDSEYVVQNPYITSFSAANVKHILTVPYFVNFSPAHLFSYTLDVLLAGGKSARAIHLSNVIWHGWVVCMVYLLAWTIRADVLTAAIAALLFAVHPAHVEVAAWISSRKDLVATGFAVLSMACYVRDTRARTGRVGWWAASLLSFIIASAGKQSVILLPAVMLAWDVFVDKRLNWRVIADKIPFGLVTVLFSWMTWHAQPATNGAYDLTTMAAIEIQDLQLLTGFGDYAMYRHYPEPAAWPMLVRMAIVMGAVLAWIAPLLLLRFRRPLFAVLWYWVMLQLVPPMVFNFVVPVTDRYLFLPSVGLCLLLPFAGNDLVNRFPAGRSLVSIGALLLGLAWGVKASDYLGEWCDPRTVWHYSAPKAKNGQAYLFLGNNYHNSADHINALLQSGKRDTLTNELPLASVVLGDAGRVDALRAEWSGAAASRTNSNAYVARLRELAWDNYELAVQYQGKINIPDLYLRRGAILVAQGHQDLANREYAKAIDLAMAALRSAKSHHKNATTLLRSIARIYMNMRDYKSARDWYLQAQAEQNQSGEIAVPTLDDEVARITKIAAGQ